MRFLVPIVIALCIFCRGVWANYVVHPLPPPIVAHSNVGTGSSSYTVAARILYRGDQYPYPPSKIYIISSTTTGSYSVRIYNATNAQTVVERTGLTNTAPALTEITVPSNVPEDINAIFEVQIKVDSGVLATATLHRIEVWWR